MLLSHQTASVNGDNDIVVADYDDNDNDDNKNGDDGDDNDYNYYYKIECDLVLQLYVFILISAFEEQAYMHCNLLKIFAHTVQFCLTGICVQ